MNKENKEEFVAFVASLEHHEKRHWTAFRHALNRTHNFAGLLMVGRLAETDEEQKVLEKRMESVLEQELPSTADYHVLSWMLREVREHSAPYYSIRAQILEVLKNILPTICDFIGPRGLYSLRLHALQHPSQLQLVEKRMVEVLQTSTPHEWWAESLMTIVGETAVTEHSREIHGVAALKLVELVVAIPDDTTSVPLWFIRLVEHRHALPGTLASSVSKKIEQILTTPTC